MYFVTILGSKKRMKSYLSLYKIEENDSNLQKWNECLMEPANFRILKSPHILDEDFKQLDQN